MSLKSPYFTIGAIAALVSAPLHRVRYVIESRDIEPTGRAGKARVFAKRDVERIRAELARIDRMKGVGDALGAR